MKFLTVKEAARLTNKSISTIRRIIYPILDDDQHPDRAHVEPNPEEARRLRADGVSFPWRISEELLRREIPDDPIPAGGRGGDAAKRATAGDGHGELIQMLRRELDIKNSQIERQAELLSQLGERIRESNILMGTLQNRLALTEASDPPVVVAASPKPPSKSEKGSGRKSSKPKRRWFSWGSRS